jgi:ribosomal protein S12 methylthiotransferase accessory factor
VPGAQIERLIANQHAVNGREHPDLAELRARTDEPGHLATLIPKLVDPYVGIARGLERFEKDPSEPFLPHVYRGELANHRFLGVETRQHRAFSGKGMSESAAQTSAVGEAVERYSAGVWAPEELRYCRRSELDERSIDPVDLVLFRPEQYPGLHYRPYTGDNRLGWIRGRSLSHGDFVWVPAIAALMSYLPVLPEEYLFQTTSNGLAAGPTLAHAILSAALEVVERDAFLLTWLARLPVGRVPAAGHPDPDVRTIVETHARRGVSIELYRLGVGHSIPAFAAAAIEEGLDAGGPAAVFGMGAAYDAADAARQAIIEVAQIRPALRRRMRTHEGRERLERLVVDPHAVATIEDHDLLYASQHALPALGFLRNAPELVPPWHDGSTEADPAVQLARLCDDLAEGLGGELVYVNLTSPELAALGLYTARAVIPGMQPIDFGWQERRLGGARLRDLPATLGLRAGPLELDAINDDPHPIA